MRLSTIDLIIGWFILSCQNAEKVRLGRLFRIVFVANGAITLQAEINDSLNLPIIQQFMALIALEYGVIGWSLNCNMNYRRFVVAYNMRRTSLSTMSGLPIRHGRGEMLTRSCGRPFRHYIKSGWNAFVGVVRTYW